METTEKGKMEQALAELGRKIDLLLQKARNSSGDLQQELHERMEELNRSKEKLEKELSDFTQDEAKWKEVQTHLHRAGEEIRQAIRLSFRGKEKNSHSPS